MMFERELKLDLSREENLGKLLAKTTHAGPSVRQLNCFLDTPDGFLRELRYGFRVRFESGKHVLTVKGPRIGDGPLSVRREEEVGIDASLASRMTTLGIGAEALPDLPPLNLLREVCGYRWVGLVFKPVLTFVNDRQEAVFEREGKSVRVELDRTEYSPGGVFFELEAEFEKESDYLETEPVLREILIEAGVPWKLSEMSKFARGMSLKSGSRI